MIVLGDGWSTMDGYTTLLFIYIKRQWSYLATVATAVRVMQWLISWSSCNPSKHVQGPAYDCTWWRWPPRYGLCNGSSAVQVVSPPHTLTLTYWTSRHIPGGVTTWPADEPLHNRYRGSHHCQVRSIGWVCEGQGVWRGYNLTSWWAIWLVLHNPYRGNHRRQVWSIHPSPGTIPLHNSHYGPVRC